MWKAALQPYIKEPQSFLEDEVIFYDDEVVIINDKFAKATVHLLVLPRNPTLTKLYPGTALTYAIKDHLSPFIERAQVYAFKYFMKHFAFQETSQWFDDKNAYEDEDIFIEKFIKVGVHGVPSMSNLHIHVITKDFNSAKMKNKKHFNSFNTDFFINWDQLPLDEKPDFKHLENDIIKNSPLICSYCGKDYNNKFSLLKKHLHEEFDKHFTTKGTQP